MTTTMEGTIYNQKAEVSGKIKLPESIFSVGWNGDLVHQVTTALRANARRVIAHTKGRGEVSGGGKKPWRQKGTGRARHGSTRSPIWRHGGVTHGPIKEENYSQKINRKMVKKALATVLSAKLKEHEVLFLDNLKMSTPKTRDAQVMLNDFSKVKDFAKINYKVGKRALIITPKLDKGIYKSFRNIKSTLVEDVRNINPLHILSYKYVVFVDPENALKSLTERVTAKK